MQGKSTFEKSNEIVSDSSNSSLQGEPSTQVLNFLKKFARSYHVESSLPNEFNSFCLN